MRFNIMSPLGFFADADNGSQHGESEHVSKVMIGTLGRWVRALLVCCVAVDAVIVVGLAVWDATFNRSAWDLIGTALLSGIAISCVLALGVIFRNSENALLTVLVSQIFVVCLTVYIWLIDQRSPVGQLAGVTGIALVLGGIALLWALILGWYSKGAVTRGAIVVAALFPLIGLAQFWLQNEYLPSSSMPSLDVQVELSPTGSSGPTIHLRAKVTIHNRGTSQVDIPAALIRVHTYPKGIPTEPPTTENVAAHLDEMDSMFSDYRQTPVIPTDATLIYANATGATVGGGLSPGETDTQEAIVDIDSRTVWLARLETTILAITHRAVSDIRNCYPPRKSSIDDPTGFSLESRKLHEWPGFGKVLCTEIQLASRGAIDELVSDHPVIRIITIIQNNALSTPMLLPVIGTRESVNDPATDAATGIAVAGANPSVVLAAHAEYTPSDTDLHPGR